MSLFTFLTVLPPGQVPPALVWDVFQTFQLLLAPLRLDSSGETDLWAP